MLLQLCTQLVTSARLDLFAQRNVSLPGQANTRGASMIGPIGWMELTIILIIALLVVGPKGLPKLGRSIGKALREFKREASELKQAVEFEIDEEERKETEEKRRKRQKAKKEKETAAEAEPESSGGESQAG